jgi:alpha/beta superfamily hydrolase
MERPIRFINKQKNLLYGILHEPDYKKNKKIGVLCLNTGMQYRIIWHRLNIKIARRLCNQGYSVLRFDTHGIGESEGELDIRGQNIEDFHDAIQTGLFVSDTLSAIEFFRKEADLDQLYLIGPCGGALTAVITAAKTNCIDGIVYMSGPVTITSSELTLDMHPKDAQNRFTYYCSKILSPKSWFTFLSGQSSYREIFFTIKVIFQNKVLKKQWSAKTDDEAEKGGLLFNHTFFDSFKKYLKNDRRILFLMPEHDRSSWGFRELFEKQYLKPGNPYEDKYELHYVKNANHIFADNQAQTYVFENIERWLP